MRLSHREYKRLSDSLLQLYSFADEATWHADVADLLPEVVNGDATVCVESIIPKGSARTIFSHFSSQPRVIFSDRLMEAIEKYNNEDPLAQYFMTTRDCRQARLRSDFISRPRWERETLYNEVYRPTNLLHTASLTASMLERQDGEHALFMVLHRENKRKNFTEGDRSMLTLLRPHLIQSRRTTSLIAELKGSVHARERAVDQAAGGIVSLDDEGHIRWATPKALDLLVTVFGRQQNGRLPDVLERWHRQEDGQSSKVDTLSAVHEPFRVRRENRELEIRHLRASADRSHVGDEKHGCLLFFSMRHIRIPLARVKALGLRPREEEVLRWAAEGKTNPEIALILSISQRTVQKHLERAFQILGVETRTAAALRFAELLKAIP